jgi:hypothetical protein
LQRFLVVKGDQGLGNRILSLLSAVLLARLTERRLVVDWRDPFYSPGERDAFHELLVLDAPSLEPESLPDTDSVRPSVWRGMLHESASAMRRRLNVPARAPRGWVPLCVDLARIDHPEHVLVFTCYHEQIDPLRRFMTGALAELRRLPTDEILRRLWAETLSLASPLQERVDTFRRAFLDGRPSVGVHVRASDRRTRRGAIEATVARLITADARRRIVLATDNADVLRDFSARFRDVVSIDKWYPPAGEPMHGHPGRPDPIRDAADALVDLSLLAACDALVVDSRSSFGRLAALRSVARHGGVVDVYPGRVLPPIVRRALLRVRDEVVARCGDRGH